MSAYLSRPAELDLERIFEQIHERSPQNAAAFLDRVEAALDSIGSHPRLARIRSELPFPGLRVVRAKPTLLIYRVHENGDAEVLRVAHERQDVPSLVRKLSAD